MIIEKFPAGEKDSSAFKAISEMMADYEKGASYADMIRWRLSGKAAEDCTDIYYVSHENGKALSRHWMGWGNHRDAVGNWGNFYTVEAMRGKGIGGQLLDFWYKDFKALKKLPLCLLCSAGTEALTHLYAKFGFVPALDGASKGPLYCPIGDSPKTFREFSENYYKPSCTLTQKKATISFRHEIDCLLRFTFYNDGLSFGIGEVDYMDKALLYHADRATMLFSEDGHCVGWGVGEDIQVHPMYRNAKIIKE